MPESVVIHIIKKYEKNDGFLEIGYISDSNFSNSIFLFFFAQQPKLITLYTFHTTYRKVKISIFFCWQN